MHDWDAAFEEQCTALTRQICEASDRAATTRGWEALTVHLAGPIEGLARGSWILRRWRVNSEDDVRTVLVRVLERMAANDYKALRAFGDRQASQDDSQDAQQDVIERAAVLAEEAGEREDDDAVEIEASPSAGGGSPFRAFLLTLVKRSAIDHVRQRLGWRAPPKPGEQRGSKRDLASGAAPLDAAPEAAGRPPITDYLTVKAFVEEVEDFTSQFPAPMREALQLWMQEKSFPEIAESLGLDDADAARKLVRAAQARLRSQFRDRWASLRLG